MTLTPHPYPAYKPSGVPWLGNVPEHWEVRRLKHAATIVAGQSPPSEIVSAYLDDSPFLQGNAEFGHLHPTPRLACEIPPKRATVGDILLSVRAPVGALNVADQEYGIGRGLCAVRPHLWFDALFIYNVLGIANQELLRLSTGSTYDAVTIGIVGGLGLPLPPLSEQRAIVRYLDYVDRRIRRYVSVKRKLIALLEEEKQAVVNRAVTRGLDPNVRLKPSDVEWLGDVPEHWEISRVKIEFLSLNHRRVPLSAVERGAMSVRRYDYYGASGVIDKVEDYLFDDDLLLIAEDGANLVLRNLPLAIVARGKFWVNNHAHILKPRRGNLEYLAAVMERLNYTPWISGAAQPKLTQDRLMSIAIAVPPPSEQEEVIDKVTEETAALRHAIARARRQIELVQEYRTRLIADVVTGKLDVREAAAQLPDEDNEAEPVEENGPLADSLPGDLYSIDESVEDLVMEEEVTA